MIQTVICSVAILGTMLVALLAVVPTIGEVLDARTGPGPRRPVARRPRHAGTTTPRVLSSTRDIMER